MIRRPPLPQAQRPIFERLVRMTVEVRNPKDGRLGAGVVITDTGLILTAYHTLSGAKHAQIRRCRMPRGTWQFVIEGRYTADIIHVDKRMDVAVLLLRRVPKRLKHATLSDDALNMGEPVYRVGRDQYGIDSGHVIGFGKHEGVAEVAISVQADFGSSGGPVFDTEDRLVAVMLRAEARDRNPSISYAVPISAIRKRLFRRKAVKTHLPEDLLP